MFLVITIIAWAYFIPKKIYKLKNLSEENIAGKAKKRPREVAVPNFPNVTWLTAKDVMKICDISIDILKQHIENGLPSYIKISESEERPLIKIEI